jgi:glutaminyl-tRNA synthetase
MNLKEDLQWLTSMGRGRYASDYFNSCMIGLLMIKDGKAYIDSQSSEDMAKQKGTPQPGVDGPYRNRSLQEILLYLKE